MRHVALERRASSEDQAKPQPRNETVKRRVSRSSETKRRAVQNARLTSRTVRLKKAKTLISLGCTGVRRPHSIEQVSYPPIDIDYSPVHFSFATPG